jgi:quinoprotein glucose dehydrogenase
MEIAKSLELRTEPELAQDWIQACTDNHVAAAGETLVAWVKDEKQSGPVRAAALRGLMSLEAAELPDSVRFAVASKNHDLRAAAIDYLPKLDPTQALALAETVMRDGELRERRAALRVLGKLSTPGASKLVSELIDRQAAGLLPAELALDLALAAETKKEGGVPEKLAKLRAPRQSDPMLATYLDSLYGGDFKRGRKLFREKDELACMRCHKIEEGEGGEVGPDLVGLGNRSARVDMLTSICDPNRAIAEGFRNTVLFLKDETHLEGRVMSQDAKTLTLIDAQAKIHEVAVSDIEERREGQSAMPTDLTKNISREEMRDLIEYLSRL